MTQHDHAPAGTPAGAVVLYIDDCPHWTLVARRLRIALARLGLPSSVHCHKVASAAEAETIGFRGSPTILIDGQDPFPTDEAPTGLSCRLYCTKDGVIGVPTVDQLVTAIRPA
ncbi:MAG: thioredoxin family protein [Mycobacteriales bacterium]|nr:thioredoxin family protein [Frankia sp.]